MPEQLDGYESHEQDLRQEIDDLVNEVVAWFEDPHLEEYTQALENLSQSVTSIDDFLHKAEKKISLLDTVDAQESMRKKLEEINMLKHSLHPELENIRKELLWREVTSLSETEVKQRADIGRIEASEEVKDMFQEVSQWLEQGWSVWRFINKFFQFLLKKAEVER